MFKGETDTCNFQPTNDSDVARKGPVGVAETPIAAETPGAEPGQGAGGGLGGVSGGERLSRG